jgi:3-deoxy-D-manno-octulosonic-acid transferase
MYCCKILHLRQTFFLSLFFYLIFLKLYRLGISIAALLNPKARMWLKGRKGFPVISKKSYNEVRVWMHCASLGEFEQGRPVIETIKKTYPAVIIILTFFSPSGYNIIKNYKGADFIYFLPEDGRRNASRFIGAVEPDLVIWVKYEYWYFYLNELKKKSIPALLISGIYRSNMPFFRWYGKLWREMAQTFNHFFVQNNASNKVLRDLIDPSKITVAGDTRFDRVTQIAENFTPMLAIEKFCGRKKVIVCGSTWEADEAEWTHFVRSNKDIRFIIAPHEIDQQNLIDLKKSFPSAILYSDWEKSSQDITDMTGVNCLIIDNIGMLSRLYYYASITYVGGGFGSDGLHNILEAAVYGKPVIFGPEYEKNFEAIELIRCGGAISIENALELEGVFNKLLNNTEELKVSGEAAKNYVYDNQGATEKIMAYIQKKRLLTN